MAPSEGGDGRDPANQVLPSTKKSKKKKKKPKQTTIEFL